MQSDRDVKPSLPLTSKSTPTSLSGFGSGSGPSTSLSVPSKSSRPTTPADADALNSDLDESDEDLLSDDEGDGENDPSGLGGSQEGDVIIALYEKVQRVKNKWKITLKDGVINAEGKDWVFSKCQG